jgi:tetratricopeptide (TPR) repeat protein
MSQLPRPLKQVLSEASDASVVRTWARLQRTRRLGRPRTPLLLATAGLALVVLGGWFVRGRLDAAATTTLADARSPSPTVSAILAKGRQASASVPRSTSQPLHVTTASEPEPNVPMVQRSLVPADPVGALLESASEAVRASKFTRAAALLAEVGEHHPADRRTATALYALGRLQLENLQQPNEARRSFTRALELNPPEELVVPLWDSLEEASLKTSGQALDDAN